MELLLTIIAIINGIIIFICLPAIAIDMSGTRKELKKIRQQMQLYKSDLKKAESYAAGKTITIQDNRTKEKYNIEPEEWDRLVSTGEDKYYNKISL